MRLPSIPIQQSVAPLAQHDVSQAQRDYANKAGLTGQIVDSSVDLMGKAYDTHQTFKQEEATAKFADSMRSMEREMAGKEFYSPDEIPDTVDIRRMDTTVDNDGNIIEVPRERIPAYEVNPALYEAKSKAWIDAYGEGITGPKYKNAWLKSIKAKSAEASQKVVLDSISKQKIEIKNMNIESIADALDNRNYDVAMGLADSDNFSSTESTNFKDEIRNRKERDTYDDSISTDDYEGMKAHLSFLQDEEYNEDLNEAERLTYITKLKSAIGSLEKKSEVNYDAQMKRLKRDIDRTVDSIENGNIVDTEQLSSLLERANAAYSLDEDGMVLHYDKLNEIVSYADEVVAFTQQNNATREKIIASMRKGGLDTYEAVKLKVFQNVDNNIARRIEDDVVSLGSDVGLIGIANMPDPSNTEEYMKWLSSRGDSHDALVSAYGEGAFLTKDEQALISNNLELMTNDQKMYYMGMVSESLGNDAPLYWQQFTDSEDGIYAVAGTAYAQGDIGASRAILNGKQFIDSGSYVKPPKIDMDMAQSKFISGAFGLDSQRSAVKSAVEAAYAHLAKKDGEYDSSQLFNTKRYETAVNMVTGGLVEIGGNIVAPPIRGMQRKEFDSYIRDVDTEWFDNQGGVTGYVGQHDQLRKDIRNGDVRLIGIGQNEYLLYSEIQGVDTYLLNDKNSQPFVFKYDPNAKTVSRNWLGFEKDE